MSKVVSVCVLVWVCSCHLLLLLSSHASLVISYFSYYLMLLLSSRSSLVFLRAGLRPALFLMGKVFSARVPVGLFSCHIALLLLSTVCLVISCLCCLFRAGLQPRPPSGRPACPSRPASQPAHQPALPSNHSLVMVPSTWPLSDELASPTHSNNSKMFV